MNVSICNATGAHVKRSNTFGSSLCYIKLQQQKKTLGEGENKEIISTPARTHHGFYIFDYTLEDDINKLSCYGMKWAFVVDI